VSVKAPDIHSPVTNQPLAAVIPLVAEEKFWAEATVTASAIVTINNRDSNAFLNVHPP
jgi:hypothetical protein